MEYATLYSMCGSVVCEVASAAGVPHMRASNEKNTMDESLRGRWGQKVGRRKVSVTTAYLSWHQMHLWAGCGE